MIYFPAGTGESQLPLPSSCSGKVDESSFYISPDELNANSISDIKTFNPRISFPSTGGWKKRTQERFRPYVPLIQKFTLL